MSERLSLIRQQPRSILDWWSATSSSQTLLTRAYPKARIHRMDPPEFDSAHSSKATWAGRWMPWRRGDTELSSAAAASPVQLLWSNMMLHWVQDRAALFQEWHARTETDGFLMFSCFGPDTLRELSALYAELAWGPASSDWVDMHDLGDDLVHAGFADPVMDMELIELSWSDVPAMLTELRGLGCNTSPRRHQGLRTPAWQRRFNDTLSQRLAGPDGRPRLTFEIIYGHAFRPAPRLTVQRETQISVDTLRSMLRKRGDPGTGQPA